VRGAAVRKRSARPSPSSLVGNRGSYRELTAEIMAGAVLTPEVMLPNGM